MEEAELEDSLEDYLGIGQMPRGGDLPINSS